MTKAPALLLTHKDAMLAIKALHRTLSYELFIDVQEQLSDVIYAQTTSELEDAYEEAVNVIDMAKDLNDAIRTLEDFVRQFLPDMN